MTAWSDIKRDLTPDQREQVDVLKGEMRAASESREAALESALRRVLSTRLHQDYGPTGEFTDCRCAACTFAQQVLKTPSELPQVYVNYSEDDGGLDVTVTRGQVEVIHVDWGEVNAQADVLGHTIGRETPDAKAYLVGVHSDLGRVADPDYRARLLDDFIGVIGENELTTEDLDA